MSKIKRLAIKGFRAFGAEEQTLNFSSQLVMVWGSNSQGKTSLAEAIEFLITGRVVRRELLASAKREFAGALRNVHLPSEEEVSVTADIEDDAGQSHTVCRRLSRDYTGRDQCESLLTVDGVPAADLTTVGVQLSQPPLEAPVLLLHTLRYVLSADPQKRADYFKALLAVTDLEGMRAAVAASSRSLTLPDARISSSYDACRKHARFATPLSELQRGLPSRQAVECALLRAFSLILDESPGTLEAGLRSAKERLKTRRDELFPVDALLPGDRPAYQRPGEPTLKALEVFAEKQAALTSKAADLSKLFEELLNIPGIAETSELLDCPVCETRAALTPKRIEAIREQLQSNDEYRRGRKSAEHALSELRLLADHIERDAAESGPLFLHSCSKDKRLQGFSIEKIGELLGTNSSALTEPWQAATDSLRGTYTDLVAQSTCLKRHLKGLELDGSLPEALACLRELFSKYAGAREHFLRSLDAYQQPSELLIRALREEVDRHAETEGWQELISLAERHEELFAWLLERAAYRKVESDLGEALTQIDESIAQVLDDKFEELSDEILKWWGLLRPDELTSFDGVQRGGSGRRYIDLKARLTQRAEGLFSITRKCTTAIT